MKNEVLEGVSTKNTIQTAGTIYSTRNYDLFKVLKDNREISQKLKKKLLQSLGQKNIFGASTILVKQHDDGFYYIYEGQHRFNASKELEQPIFFIINQDLTTEDISLMNTNSDVWVLKDFLRKYLANNIDGKYESYQRLQKLLDEFSSQTDDDSVRNITFTDILCISTGWGANVTNQFKNGTLKILEDDYDKSVKTCRMLQKFLHVEILPENINVRKYIRAIMSFVEGTIGWTPNDTTYLLKKVKDNKSMIDNKNYGKEEMYKELLYEIYNKAQYKRCVDMKKTRGGRSTQYYIEEYKTK